MPSRVKGEIKQDVIEVIWQLLFLIYFGPQNKAAGGVLEEIFKKMDMMTKFIVVTLVRLGIINATLQAVKGWLNDKDWSAL